MEKYKCSKCKVEKPVSEFYKDKGSKNGFNCQCKKCRDLYKKNNVEYKAVEYKRIKERHIRDPRQKILSQAKVRAKEEGIPFSITLDDIIIPNKCPVLNIELKIGNKFNRENSPSLDKIIPKLGYVRGNVCVISHRANRLKGNSTIDEIIAVINYIKENKRLSTERLISRVN